MQGQEEKHPSHRWKLRLELTSDDCSSDPSTVVIELSGVHLVDGCTRPVNESIAIHMAAALKMLVESCQLIGESSFDEAVEAFAGN